MPRFLARAAQVLLTTTQTHPNQYLFDGASDMPIYEYRCSACSAELEKLQKISDAPLVECPECGKPALVKLVSASSFRLKGSGWYETDFKTGKKKNGVDESSTASSGEAAGTATNDMPAAPAATGGASAGAAANTSAGTSAGNSTGSTSGTAAGPSSAA